MSGSNIWDQVLARIETKVNRHSFYTWFKPTSFVSEDAASVTVRVPNNLFKDWLTRHYPLKANHVMSRVHEMRGGRDNDPAFGSRMRGSGELADLLAQRFHIACKRIGFDGERRNRALDTTVFKVPVRAGQLSLF